MRDDGTLSFSQREGYAEISTPLKLEQLPANVRIHIWNVLFAQLSLTHVRLPGGHAVVGQPWKDILKDLHMHHYNRPLDEWDRRLEAWRTELRNYIERHGFNYVFDLIEFIMRHPLCPPEFIEGVANVFSNSQLAYTIDVGPPPIILQATTPEEGDQLTENLKELRAAGLHAATTHLHSASKCINEGDWSGSIRESIHAVESVAKQVDPDGSQTLGAALDSLEKRGVLQHKALKKALSTLYGYTSDEKGIRHALLEEGKSNVTIDEAVFMLGACASFASYLWRKHKAANTQ